MGVHFYSGARLVLFFLRSMLGLCADVEASVAVVSPRSASA